MVEFRQYFVNYFARTSVTSGLRQAGRSRHWYWQIIWTVLFCIGIVLFTLQAKLLIEAYMRFPRRTEVHIINVNSFPFPAVTLCNLNPFKRSEIAASAELTKIMSAYNYQTKKRQNEGVLHVKKKRKKRR